MKKIILALFFIISVTTLFAGKNGNGGKDKIGGYIGWPTGLTYSHEFNNLVELDLLVGWNGFGNFGAFGSGGLIIQLGALFTVFEPVIDTQICPLSIGPVIGTTTDFIWNINRTSVDILVPLRWEVNLKDIPAFNLFIEYGPGIGFYVNDSSSILRFTSRGGLGLRYRIK